MYLQSHVLTGDVSGSIEVAHNLGVDIDPKLLLINELLVTSLHLFEDPVAKGLTNERICHVDNPLAREARILILDRQVVEHLRILDCLFQDLLDTEAFVLRNTEVLHAFTRDELLGALHQVF